MKFSVERNNARLELRLLELEDTVEVMAQVVGTMAEMLGGLNKVAAHYADTMSSSLLPLLSQVGRPASQPVPLVSGEPGAGRCAGDCACAAGDGPPDGAP